MSPLLVFTVIAVYFSILVLVSLLTSRKATSETFFRGNRSSPWFLVAFGMIGASISGVTFISVPGDVGNIAFGYFQLVLGYIPGYMFIYLVLLPMYYKYDLISIYSFLGRRFGKVSYKTGSIFFLASQTMGASLRLFLAALVLQIAFFNAFGIPFIITVACTIALIWLYTFKGGIKTIVWTDTLQTMFMLTAMVLTIFSISKAMGYDFSGMVNAIVDSPQSKIFNWDWSSKQNFFKQFFSGAFIAIVMTGLDQNMMQKNLTCKTLRHAQKNMFWMSLSLIPVNLLFLSLGVLLYSYAASHGIAIPERSDELFPLIALKHFDWYVSLLFLLGITSAAFSSADSALTALTTSFCYDFLGFENKSEEIRKKQRVKVHLAFSLLMLIVIVVFKELNDSSVIQAVFTVAGYTYGPLLGLFFYGLFTKWRVYDKAVPFFAVASPLLTYLISFLAKKYGDYSFSYELLMLNGIIMFGLLGLSSVLKAEPVK
ncbi:MAG: sodium:solute symporter [Bacteroidetes bacterium HGW-Bacteroidetes-21]|nr:MAG: sodium:solute symporter [Bacteroidetes bacterium HGW-Bacteroidetes-21]